MAWTTPILHVLVRDLRALRREVEAYPDDESPWKTVPGISNSGGALARHLAGNLRHFVGALLGATGYVRDRDAEFAGPPQPRRELLELIDAAIPEVETGMRAAEGLAPEADYPGDLGSLAVRTDEFLVHLVIHLGYHLGQIDYHRRMVTGVNVATHAVALGELPSARPAVQAPG